MGSRNMCLKFLKMIQIPLFGAFQRGTSYAQNMGSQYVHKFWWFLVFATGLPKNQLPTSCHWCGCGPSKIQKFYNQL